MGWAHPEPGGPQRGRTWAGGEHGRKLVSFHYSFGGYDDVLMVEAPDEKAVAAMVLASVSTGHVKSIKTTTLLSVEDAMEVFRRAGEATFRGAGRQ